MKKLFFLINPVSGKYALEDNMMRVLEIFSKADYEVTVCFTKSEEDVSEQVINRGAEFDLIVCCGGDGTLNLVASALYLNNIDTLLGYIPGGTTNDFANSREISTSVINAAKQIVEGEVHGVDLGVLNGKPFIYVAAFGMFADVSYLTTREMKQNIGYAAYLMGGLKSFAKTKPFKLKTEHDGEVKEEEYIFGMISNSKRVGGLALGLFKNTDFDDGEMEVMLVKKPKNPADTQRLLNCLISQTPDDKELFHFKTSSIKISSDTEIAWSLDGEFGGSFKEMNIEVKKAAIHMVF